MEFSTGVSWKDILFGSRYQDGFRLFLDDGHVDMDSNLVENAIRVPAMTRRNTLFCRSRGRSLFLGKVCKPDRHMSPERRQPLCILEPHGYLSTVLTAIAGGHKQTDINLLLPWNYVNHV